MAETLGHYRILRPLGKGGMGEVYAAEDTKLGRSVALKVLPPAVVADPARRARFEREARAVAALNHPGIVTIHSVEESEGVPFMTMELIDGQPLSELIPQRGMALDRFLELAVPLADAVSAAHRQGIVHRDLKPANIMATGEGRLKVLDFGLAKVRETEPSGGRISAQLTLEQTRVGTTLGTAAYMSPEQAEGKAVDARTDVFSLGIVMYEMATGRRPFAGDTAVGVLSSILKDAPVPVADLRPELPSGVGRIIRRCLEKDPGRRMQTALDLRNELEELKHEPDPSPARLPSAAPPTPELVARYKATGDPVHLASLFERYGHLILGVGLRYLHNREDAEDAAMEVYERLMTALLKHEIANFESWLHAVVANHCRMTLRRRKGAPKVVEASEDLLDAMLAGAPAAHEDADAEGETQALSAALGRLNEGQRRCLELFYLEGRSYAEVARRTGYALGEVKSHIQNGKRNLRALLATHA